MIWPLTRLVQLWHMTIWPLTWLVQLWKVPHKTPLLAYINLEFVAIKWNCLDRAHVQSGCLSLAKGLGRRTAGSPLLGTREVPLPLSFCGAPPALTGLGNHLKLHSWGPRAPRGHTRDQAAALQQGSAVTSPTRKWSGWNAEAIFLSRRFCFKKKKKSVFSHQGARNRDFPPGPVTTTPYS